ncbi:TPA: DUF551 domain-containing protein [Escherichia coli]|nr:DUF551 domain-containing protein [Escherichia coli]HEC3723458.1 DUF551 domain-containing protein [Escherichia coli]
MTTITKERIELFIKNPLENGLTRGEQMELARIALASLEADPVKRVNSDQMRRVCLEANRHLDKYDAMAKEVNKLLGRIAPPAPVVPDNASEPLAYAYKELTPEIMRNHLAVFERYGIAPNDSSTTIQALRIALDGIERSGAMLHSAEPASNHEELPLDYLQGQKDGLEWAAQLAEANHPQTGDWLYDDPLELAKAIRKGPDMPEFDGPTPVTPDGWISCSERMPNDKQYVWCWGKSYGWAECNTFEGYYDWSRNKWWAVTDDGEEPASKVTHWMPLPEPPQEVK